jgi:hypothetical protein
VPVGWSMAAPKLLVRRDDGSLRVSGPQIRFLTGRPLQQLKNGSTLSFASQVSLTMGPQANPIARVFDRFVISYDLWEEKFSATRLGPPRRTATRMSAPAAESWCLDLMLPIPPTLTPTDSFWVRLELRVEEGRESSAIFSEPGINLTRLIDLFSRLPKNQQSRWMETAGPLRLEQL